MYSLILYGRNDNYGYNLHKRAALSLNCMAEILEEKDDEIIFVDYNTPNDFPTFPEAIQDTLTDKAKKKLRVLRVRPEFHTKNYKKRTHLLAIEPIARNIAVRRSNPSNKWLLSTNTDMIFIPKKGKSLNSTLENVSEKFYCAPRFEIPETMWEAFDRKDPKTVISLTRTWGKTAHLNEVVMGSEVILFDGPGDFQLIDREDMFAIGSFDEEMILGWHVDSNISKRLFLLNGKVGDASEFVSGYHCDHTRQITPAHRHNSVANDALRFVDNVESPSIVEFQPNWGASEEAIEEVSLTSSMNSRYIDVIQQVIPQSLGKPVISSYIPETYDGCVVSAEHIIPFLIDLFVNIPEGYQISWFGARDPLLNMFTEALNLLPVNYSMNVMDYKDEIDFRKLQSSSAFIFNFGVPETRNSEFPDIKKVFHRVIQSEYVNMISGGEPKRIVGINAIHNRYETMMLNYVSCAKTPFSTRLRHGYWIEDSLSLPEDWTNKVRTTENSEKLSNGLIVSKPGYTGHMIHGPYSSLMSGRYDLYISLEHEPHEGMSCNPDKKNKHRVTNIEVVVNDQVVAERSLESGSNDPHQVIERIIFQVDMEFDMAPCQVRLSCHEMFQVTLKSIHIDLSSV